MVVTAWLLALLMAAPAAVFACKCTPAPSPREAYRRAGAVLIGRIRTVTPNPGNNGSTAVVAVSRAWKKKLPAEVAIATDSTCAYEFVVGREDLLYVIVTSAGGYGTDRCASNQPLADAGKAVRWLERNGRQE